MERGVLLGVLPPYLNRYTLVKKNQDVFDIVKEVVAAHEAFKNDYDLIAPYFDGLTDVETAKRLFSFLKKNIPYEVEDEKMQTTKSPSALLTQSFGDCKHYAGFIAGILDALNRRGRNFDFAYRFASYSIWDKTPGHVFVVMWDNEENEFWIDPVLKSFNERLQPSYYMDKPIKNSFMLSRVSGIVYDGFEDVPDGIFEDSINDNEIEPELKEAIQLLLDYRVLNEAGEINDGLLSELVNQVAPEVYQQLIDARVYINQKAIGGFFGDIWHGIKAGALAAPRNAYLALVALNVFGLATKLAKAIYKPDGITIDWIGYKKVADKWTSLGGKRENLRNAVDSGKKKKALLGTVNTIGEPATGTAAIIATASAIIAALAPLIAAILNAKKGQDYSQSGISDYGLGAGDYNNYSGGGIMDFIQKNPVIVAGVGAAVIYFISKNKKR